MMKKCLVFLMAALLSIALHAQTVDFSKSPEDFFRSYVHQRDTTFSATARQKDTFWKCLSFHTNLVNWTLTVPNLAIEFDLSKTKLNNRSLLFYAEYNGRMRHDQAPRFVFDRRGARIEYRKYWRTGRLSNNSEHLEYQQLRLQKPDTLFRDVTVYNEYGEAVVEKEPYFTPEDSVVARQYNGDPYRSRFYNRYHKVRRALSGRTLQNPRNWRAYYLGAFAGYERYDYCFGKRGERGRLFAAGATMGWSIPLIAQSYPREGGLDLDLGLCVGVPVAKFDGYRYSAAYYCNESVSHFHAAEYLLVPDRCSAGWQVSPKYVLHDVHVSLIYRLRSIAHKVDLDLVDRYEQTEINPFRDSANERENRMMRSLAEAKERADSLEAVNKQTADSASWADRRQLARLKAMLELNPDTAQFHGRDSVDYIRLILGRDTVEYRKVLERQKKQRAKEAKRQAALAAQEAKRQQKEADREEKRRLKESAEAEKKRAKEAAAATEKEEQR